MISYILSIILLIAPIDKTEKKIRKQNNKTSPSGTVWIKDNLYMDSKETSNLDYRLYLNWLNENIGEESEEYKNALPDTTVWRSKLAYNEPYVELYFRHPAYSNYPVVGVSHEQAIDYCKWRTKFINEIIYKKVNKLKIDDIIDTASIPKYVKYRLPTKAEWEFSARGGLKENTYPWGGYFLTNYKGENMANFKGIGDEQIAYSDSLKHYVILPLSKPFTINDIHSLAAPVESYSPNGYGIYNIVGNIAEMVIEKGIAKGGSYLLPGYHCRIDQDWYYKKQSNHVGFRCACDKLIEW